MKIFWTIVVIIVLILGFKLLTKDSAAPTEVNNEAATVQSETDAMAGENAGATVEEGAAMDEGADATTN